MSGKCVLHICEISPSNRGTNLVELKLHRGRIHGRCQFSCGSYEIVHVGAEVRTHPRSKPRALHINKRIPRSLPNAQREDPAPRMAQGSNPYRNSRRHFFAKNILFSQVNHNCYAWSCPESILVGLSFDRTYEGKCMTSPSIQVTLWHKLHNQDVFANLPSTCMCHGAAQELGQHIAVA